MSDTADISEDFVHFCQATFATAFMDSMGRIRRENPAAFLAALNGADPATAAMRRKSDRRPRKSILDFQRDLLGANVLIGKRWGVRGTVVMIVSSTGTGKSVVQTQMAVSFALGIPCCGLAPVRPFSSWIIQSEDDDDRVAIDRDDIIEEMSALHPSTDFASDAVRNGVTFLDFTSYTGAKFLDALEKELSLTPEAERPACIFINPMNAYFGGSLKEGADCSAFFKGGTIQGKDTDGLEAIAKRYNVLVVIFGHTPKPPMKKELEDWVNDPNICYKMCGASEIADAVRSILVFLPVPDMDGVFVFNAGKNGYTLGWTDALGNKTTKAYFRWASSGRHFWEEVPKDEWPVAQKAVAARAERDEAVKVILSHMDGQGLNHESVMEEYGKWGLKSRVANAAFYEIVHNRNKYGVVTNVVPTDGGRHKTLYRRVERADGANGAQQAQAAPAEDEVQIFTEEIQI